MAGSGELDHPAELRKEALDAHHLEEHSDSEDQFTDAQSTPMSPKDVSPVRTTRVDQVDDKPAHSEVSSTNDHDLSEADVKPDAMAAGDEGDDATTLSSAPSEPPETVKEDPGEPLPASVESSQQADESPDVVLSAHGTEQDGSNDPAIASDALAPPEPTARHRRKSSKASRSPIMGESSSEDDDAFGDDFDEFEEGVQDEDFDDFEDDFQQPETSQGNFTPVQQTVLPYPIPDLDGLDSEDMTAAIEPYLASLFPPEQLQVTELPPLPKDTSSFTTPRSASLWSQLVAPPPLAPPDWIRSRTRRLFLVSLGVPVDLDEILPASKQKKLVLPSLNIPSSTSPRGSSDSRPASRLRLGEGNASSTSVDTQGKPKKRRGPAPPPDFDMVAARLTCTTTDEALAGMTNGELKAHVDKLEALQGTAKEVLEYWEKRTDEKIAERDTFEGVIENLVKHARKVRK